MRYVLAALALYLALILQLSLGPSIAVMGIQPDIVFAAVMSVAAFSGLLPGSICGAGIGFLMDLMFLSPGVYSLQYTLTGVVSGLLSARRITRFLQPLLLCVPAYFVKETVFLLTLFVQGAAFDWLSILQKVLIGAVYTAALSFVFYLLTDFISRRFSLRRNDISFD